MFVENLEGTTVCFSRVVGCGFMRHLDSLHSLSPRFHPEVIIIHVCTEHHILCVRYSLTVLARTPPPFFHRLQTMNPQSNRPTGKDLQLRKMCVGIIVNPWASSNTHDAVIPPHSHEVLLGDCDRLSRCPKNCSLTFQMHVWVSYTVPTQRLEQMTSCKAFKEYDFHKSATPVCSVMSSSPWLRCWFIIHHTSAFYVFRRGNSVLFDPELNPVG